MVALIQAAVTPLGRDTDCGPAIKLKNKSAYCLQKLTPALTPICGNIDARMLMVSYSTHLSASLKRAVSERNGVGL